MSFKKIITAAVIIAAGIASPALAQDISAGVDIKSSHELLFVTVSDKPVVQPHVTVKFDKKFAVKGWASIGSEKKGNEQRLILSYDTDLGKFSGGAYNLPGGKDFEVLVAKYQKSFSGVNFTGQYIHRTDGKKDGAIASLGTKFLKTDDFAIGGALHGGITPKAGKEFVSIDGNVVVPVKVSFAKKAAVKTLVRHTRGGPAGKDTSFMLNLSAGF